MFTFLSMIKYNVVSGLTAKKTVINNFVNVNLPYQPLTNEVLIYPLINYTRWNTSKLIITKNQSLSVQDVD